MLLVDSHCHLQDAAFDADREQVIERALGRLSAVVVAGDDLENSRRAVDLAGGRIHAVVGLHPYHAESVDAAAIDALRALAARPGAAAIGEIGLDYHYGEAPRPVQRRAFEAQLDLASELGLPVVVHNRDADDDTLEVLSAYRDAVPACVMHCFGAGPAFAERCVEWGAHISFAGNITYPRAEMLRESARVTPLDRLLVETDSPYLAPQPVRGRRCEPEFVFHTIERLAEVKDLPVEELARRTALNTASVFGFALVDPSA